MWYVTCSVYRECYSDLLELVEAGTRLCDVAVAVGVEDRGTSWSWVRSRSCSGVFVAERPLFFAVHRASVVLHICRIHHQHLHYHRRCFAHTKERPQAHNTIVIIQFHHIHTNLHSESKKEALHSFPWRHHGSLNWTGLIMLIGLFLVRFSFKFSVWFRAVD